MKMRNKLLLLSLISILGATGCSNSQEDNTLTYNQTMTEKGTAVMSFVRNTAMPNARTLQFSQLMSFGLIFNPLM